MDKEIVARIINRASAGNGDMRWLLTEVVYRDGRQLIDSMPNDMELAVERRMIHAASYLVQRRIPTDELRRKGASYWKTDGGKVAAKRIKEYVTRKKELRQRVVDQGKPCRVSA